MGHRVAPIYHSQSGLTGLRSGERISRLGGQKIEVRDEMGVWEDKSESDRKTRTWHSHVLYTAMVMAAIT